MARTKEEHRDALLRHFPRGEIWPRDEGSALSALAEGLAPEFQRAEQRIDDLLRERDPELTLEMLGDWLTHAGLPDECTPADVTDQELREMLIARLTATCDHSIPFYERLCQSLGYTDAKIEVFRPFVAGLSRCGEAMNGDHECRYRMKVTVGEAKVVEFRAGISQCGEALGVIRRAEELECLIRRFWQDHGEVVFSYLGV